mmetsp:Transcript_58872/g.175162  ORF Transcript_58872/g.175162 Transcript_58872/m.175162 type:complete len:200 (-) Transcript_58872:680-1279(-)
MGPVQIYGHHERTVFHHVQLGDHQLVRTDDDHVRGGRTDIVGKRRRRRIRRLVDVIVGIVLRRYNDGPLQILHVRFLRGGIPVRRIRQKLSIQRHDARVRAAGVQLLPSLARAGLREGLFDQADAAVRALRHHVRYHRRIRVEPGVGEAEASFVRRRGDQMGIHARRVRGLFVEELRRDSVHGGRRRRYQCRRLLLLLR